MHTCTRTISTMRAVQNKLFNNPTLPSLHLSPSHAGTLRETRRSVGVWGLVARRISRATSRRGDMAEGDDDAGVATRDPEVGGDDSLNTATNGGRGGGGGEGEGDGDDVVPESDPDDDAEGAASRARARRAAEPKRQP